MVVKVALFCFITTILQRLTCFLTFSVVISQVFYLSSMCLIYQAFSRGSTENLVHVNFIRDEFTYLNITSLTTVPTQDECECSFSCLETPSCFSYNLAVFPDDQRKLFCELLPSDKYNNSEKFGPNQFFHHFSITVRGMLERSAVARSAIANVFFKLHVELFFSRIKSSARKACRYFPYL